jgi:hypothetical protein
MPLYNEEQKCAIIRLFYKNSNNLSRAREEYRLLYGEPVPQRSTFRYIEKNFRERKSIKRKKRSVTVDENEELDILLYFQGINATYFNILLE